MRTAICPTCQAEISATEASRSHPPACPFCGSNVEECFASDGDSTASFDEENAAQPPDEAIRKIQIVEQSPDRLLLAVESGGRGAMSIVLFAVLWNAISWTVAIVFVMAGAIGDLGALGVLPFVGIGLFLVIGAALVAWAVNASFGRAFVLVEPNQASVQTILFGWKRTKSAALGPASSATLEEAYKQNNVPVYRVRIGGPNGSVSFGVALPHADKLWAVEMINRVIDPARSGDPSFTPVRADSFEALFQAAENAPAVDPANLRVGSLVRIEEAAVDRLVLSYPLLPRSTGLLSASIAFIVMSLIVGFVWSTGFGRGGIDGFVLFLLPFSLVLVLQVVACAAILRGRITVRVDADKISVRWHVGPFGPSKFLRTGDVNKVAIMASGEAMRHLAVAGSPTASIPLTTFHDRAIDEDVAGLVRWQLERLGRTLS